MRQQSYELMLTRIIEAIHSGQPPFVLKNLAVKAQILLEGGDKSAAVIKELNNND